MKKQLIEFRDPVVQSVVNKFVDRSDVGFKKYGKTMRDDKSDLFTWLNHVQEELMDATLYIQRLKEEIGNLREERLLRDAIHDLDVIDPEIVISKKKKLKSSKIGSGRGDHYTFTIDEPITTAINAADRYISTTTNTHFAFGHPYEEK